MSKRTLGIAWNVLILVALGIYVSRFHVLPATSTLFPRLVTVPMVILALVSLVRQLGNGRHGEGEQEEEGSSVDLGGLLGAVAAGAVYVLLWTVLGFVLDTVVFIAVVPLLAGFGPWRRRWPITLGLGLAVAALFLYLFHLGSGSILPGGVWHVG